MRTIELTDEIGVKRFYLPGVELKGVCACGAELSWSGDGDYVSNPVPGEPEEIFTYCDECGEDEVRLGSVTLRVQAEIVEGED